jgi:hypothetical protein
MVEKRKPAIDALTAAQWTAAGICAHESALQEGAALSKGDIKEVLKHTGAVIGKNPRSKFADAARKIAEEASAGGEAALKEAEALVATDPVSGMVKLDEVICSGTVDGDGNLANHRWPLEEQLGSVVEVVDDSGAMKTERPCNSPDLVLVQVAERLQNSLEPDFCW